MEPADFMEPEIAVTAAITAAICSPRARKVMRKGLVYGMAGILTAGDVVTTFARNVRQGVMQAGKEGEAAKPTAQETEKQAQAAKAGKTESETAGPQPRKTTDKKTTTGGQSE